MKKLHELLGLPLSKGVFGVEIECEGRNLRVADNDLWKTERDGSLRGNYPTEAAEFVMTKPVTALQLPKAIENLIEIQKGAVFKFSFRTSVHVHVNVQELTEDQLLAFIYACLILEEPLMNFCGEHRRGNRFCLRMKDAEGYDKTLRSLFHYGYSSIIRLDGDAIRYSAINIHALRKYGSVEFRGMRGNMDKDVLIPWCNTLLAIRNAAIKLGSPIAVYNEFIKKGNEEFAKEMMGKHFDLFNYPDLDRDMSGSFSLTIELPHIFKNKQNASKRVDTYVVMDGVMPGPPPAPEGIAELVRAAQRARVVPARPQQEIQYAPVGRGEVLWVNRKLHKYALGKGISLDAWKQAFFNDKLAWYKRNYEVVAEEF